MESVFVESGEFTEWVAVFLPDEAYARTQQELMDTPHKGAVIRACGGLRKLRTADPGRGKGRRSTDHLHVCPGSETFFSAGNL